MYHIPRVYVDTSVVGGLFDATFQWQTKPFWDAICNGEIIVILSDVLEREVKRAPQHVLGALQGLPQSQIERIVSTKESNGLAARYVAEKVVGQSSLDDCRHIALATIHRADCLVSWNFKHIVNVRRVCGYNEVNAILGYPAITIKTPSEVLNDHD